MRYSALMPHSPGNTISNHAGLCTECLHARRIESDRRSVFYLCELSENDPRFPKYPRLPVLLCDGFKKKD